MRNSGYFGPTCAGCTGLNQTTGLACNGHGKCDGSGTKGGTGNCTCEHPKWGGQNCDKCNLEYWDCPTSPAGVCNNRGSCRCTGDLANETVCDCERTWGGIGCSQCAKGYRNNLTTECGTCDWGYFGAGPSVKVPPDGFPNCQLCPSCPDHSYCDGNGTNAGSFNCYCFKGYSGPFCTKDFDPGSLIIPGIVVGGIVLLLCMCRCFFSCRARAQLRKAQAAADSKAYAKAEKQARKREKKAKKDKKKHKKDKKRGYAPPRGGDGAPAAGEYSEDSDERSQEFVSVDVSATRPLL